MDKDIKPIKIGNKIYKLNLWDTSGQERFRELPRKYFKHVDGVLLFFDVTSEETFDSVSNWIKFVKDNSNKNITNDSLYLIGNKIERPDRIITKEKAEELANSFGIKYFEISCKLNMNIHEVMARIIMESHMRINHENLQINSFKKLNKFLSF